MVEEEKYHHRRWAVLLLVCLLFPSAIILYNSRSSSYEVIRRLSLYKHKRIRTHKVYDNDESNIFNSGITRDSHGLLVEVAIQQHTAPIQTKIINGIDFDRMAYPYIVRIHWTNPGKNADKSKYPAICGGSLISPTIVLTAAHCLDKYETHVDILDVTTGKPITYETEQSIVHPQYKDDTFMFDVGLITIKTPHLEVQVTNSTNGEMFWNLLDNDYDWDNSPPMIRLHRYPYTNSCNTLTEAEAKNATTLTVIGYRRGIGCALSGFPGVYNRVGESLAWIETSICGNENEEGLSPLSCVTNEKGERQLRDYAMEAFTQKENSSTISTTSKTRRTTEIESRMEACELLEGPNWTPPNPTTSPIEPHSTSSSPSSSPSRSPTSSPIVFKLEVGNNTDPTTSATATSSALCPADNKQDLDYFQLNAKKRRRSCKWVRRRCRFRCAAYFDCCPQTCGLRNCKE